MEAKTVMQINTIKQFGNRSEVISPDGKTIFIGSTESCMKYCDDNDVVAFDKNGNPVTRSILQKYFEMVQDNDNWKNPIKACLIAVSDYTRNMISLSIEFYTGSKAKWSNTDNIWLVTANGYYLTCGS